MARLRYKAILFAPDGEWVTDYRGSESIEEVQELLMNQGSRWYFYPFHAVIRDHGLGYTAETQRIIDAAEPFEYLMGRTIKTFAKEIGSLPLDTLANILG